VHFAHAEHVAGTPSATHVDCGTPASCWAGGGAEASVAGAEASVAGAGVGGGVGKGAGAGAEAASSAGRPASGARGGSVEGAAASGEERGSGTSRGAASTTSLDEASLPAEINVADPPASLLPTAHASRCATRNATAICEARDVMMTALVARRFDVRRDD
jgi:hypothetical protein